MSLFPLDKTVTLQRSAGSQDSGGGEVDDLWATVSAGDAVRAAIWPTASGRSTVFFRQDISSDVVIVFDTDVGAKAGDRIKHGTTYYSVQGYGPPYSNNAVTRKSLYPAWCSVRRV